MHSRNLFNIKVIKLSISLLDEFEVGSEAGEAASDACDWTACNGFTLKISVFEKEETYGQCQYPAGNDDSEDDFFCFVNADSNCADKVIFIICPTIQLILVLGSNVSATPIGQMGLKMG